MTSLSQPRRADEKTALHASLESVGTLFSAYFASFGTSMHLLANLACWTLLLCSSSVVFLANVPLCVAAAVAASVRFSLGWVAVRFPVRALLL